MNIIMAAKFISLAGLVLGFLIALFFLFRRSENNPPTDKCEICHRFRYRAGMSYMKKEGCYPIAVCPSCVGKAEERGFKVYEIALN